MQRSNACALLIGVDDYRAYGSQNLCGSVNDVAAWTRVCDALDIAPENVRVLVTGSPANDEPGGAIGPMPTSRFANLPPANVLSATRDNILASIEWLAGQLADGKTPGLLTYSGHGTVASDGALALCPTDVTPDLGNLVTLEEIAKILSASEARQLLTVVLDCCHAGTSSRTGALTLALPGKSVSAGASRPRLGARELFACKAEQTAYQSMFTDRFHGAFTWALTASLLQWRRIDDAKTIGLDISYQEARDVSQQLLDVLKYTNQTAELDAPGAGDMTFFHPTRKPDPGLVSDEPDGVREHVQIDPDYFYKFYLGADNTGTVLAQVVVPKDYATAYLRWGGPGNPTHQIGGSTSPAKEYWYINSTNSTLNSISSSSNIYVERWSLTNYGSTNPVPMSASVSTTSLFDSLASVTWISSTTTALPEPTTGTNTVFRYSPVSVLFNVTSSGGGNPIYTLVDVWWYVTGLSSPPTFVNPQAANAYSKSTTGIPTVQYYWAKSRG